MSEQISVTELAELLIKTGHQHHTAYQASNGIDPEWASWYAPYLQAKLGERLGGLPTRSELVYLLVTAEKTFQNDGANGQPWPDFYAGFILENYEGGEAD